MSRTDGPYFPEEILDLFTDALEQTMKKPESKAALKACLFVSRSFRQRSRRSLFRSVQVNCEYDRYGTKRLLQLRELLAVLDTSSVDSDTGIAPFIKSATFVMFAPNNDAKLRTYLNNRNLLDIIRWLHGSNHGIEKFSLLLHPGNSNPFSWNALSVDLRAALLDLFRSPRLCTLELKSLKNAPRSLLRGTKLKQVTLQWVSVMDELDIIEAGGLSDNDSSVDDQLPLPPLEFLHTNHTYSIDHLLGEKENADGTCAASHLKKLASTILRPDNFNDTVGIIDRAKETLQELTMSFDPIISPTHTFERRALHTLAALVFRYQIAASYDSYRLCTILQHICEILQSPPPSTELNRLEIHFSNIIVTSPEETFLLPTSKENWSLLEELLINSPYSSIESIVLKLGYHFPGGQARDYEFDAENFQFAIREHLSIVVPVLCLSPRVDIVIETTGKLWKSLKWS
ncbi:hypothetical protein B0H34DRAFT_806129 [Crassisporium funariophilum]|nr:hypothetical protein B0H34DRAFT_806129 [Crassisporium funariophilum]